MTPSVRHKLGILYKMCIKMSIDNILYKMERICNPEINRFDYSIVITDFLVGDGARVRTFLNDPGFSQVNGWNVNGADTVRGKSKEMVLYRDDDYRVSIQDVAYLDVTKIGLFPSTMIPGTDIFISDLDMSLNTFVQSILAGGTVMFVLVTPKTYDPSMIVGGRDFKQVVEYGDYLAIFVYNPYVPTSLINR